MAQGFRTKIQENLKDEDIVYYVLLQPLRGHTKKNLGPDEVLWRTIFDLYVR